MGVSIAMSGTSITFSCEKGGNAKSMCTFQVAGELSKDSRVLVIDLDSQKANVSNYFGLEVNAGTKTICDYYRKDTPAKDLIVHIAMDGFSSGVDLIPANQDLAWIDANYKPLKMKKLIRELKESYDYILLDAGPKGDWNQVLALSGADWCIIPLLMDQASITGAEAMKESVEEMQDGVNRSLKVMGFLFNRYENRTKLSRSVIEKAGALASEWGKSTAKRVQEEQEAALGRSLTDRERSELERSCTVPIFDTTIRNATALGRSLQQHKCIGACEPSSAAASDFQKLADEIKARIAEGKEA